MQVTVSNRGVNKYLTIEATSEEWQAAQEDGSLEPLNNIVDFKSPHAHITITDAIRTYLPKRDTVEKLRVAGISTFADITSRTKEDLIASAQFDEQEIMELRRYIMDPFELRFSDELPFIRNPNTNASQEMLDTQIRTLGLDKSLVAQLSDRGFDTIGDLVSLTEGVFADRTRGALEDNTSNSAVTLITEKILVPNNLEFKGGKLT